MDMFEQWPTTEVDLHEHFGIDAADRELMRSRSWRWLATRLNGLASCDSRINAWARRRHEEAHPTAGRKAAG